MNFEHINIPFKDPVLVFTVVLFIILFIPLFLKKINFPGIVGLIVAGLIIGPNGFYVLEDSDSIQLFSKVGLLYIMFVAGLEIDLGDFKKNKAPSLIFGGISFLIPQLLGTAVAYYVFSFDWAPAILFGSLFGGHTLLAYPIASKLGITKTVVVTLTVGGTIIAELLALLVLAVIASSSSDGINAVFWVKLILYMSISSFVIMWLFPKISRWFFNVESEGVPQYIFVLACAFLGGLLAELAGMEAIIGAFLAGLALNTLIPQHSALMNRIEFIGNAIFIPFFLIHVGMQVNLSGLLNGANAWLMLGAILVIAHLSKWLAAYFTQKIFSYTTNERNLIFGLSNARAAAALAAVQVGFAMGILSEDVFNGIIVMILITSLTSSIIVQKEGRKFALIESKKTPRHDQKYQKIIVPVANPSTIDKLIELALLVKNPASKEPIYALTVVKDNEHAEEKILNNKALMNEAVKKVAANDKQLTTVSRIDVNIASGIIRAMRELSITELIIGWHGKMNTKDKIFGTVLDNLLMFSEQLILVSKVIHPLNTMRRIVVVVPTNSEWEEGFSQWVDNIKMLSKQIGEKLVFYASESTIKSLRRNLENTKPKIEADYKVFRRWEFLYRLRKEIKKEDLLFVVSSRKEAVSWNHHLDQVPKVLAKHFDELSFVVMYPKQNHHLKPEDVREQLYGPIEDIFPMRDLDESEGSG